MKETTLDKKLGYKKTKLGWVPEDWKIKPFGDVFDFISTYSYSRAQLEYRLPNNNDVINIHYGDIHKTYEQELLDLDTELLMPVIIVPEAKNGDLKFLKNGDLIIADASEDFKGICDSVELKNVGIKKVTGGLHTFVARDRNGLTSDGYRCYILKNEVVRNKLTKIATGISVYGVSKRNLSKVLIPLPSSLEQTAIANCLSTWDNAIQNLTALIAQKEQLKKGLMQQLLTGKMRLKGFEGEWEEMTLNDITKRITRKNKELNDNVITISAQRGFVRQEDFFKKRVASDTLANYYLVHKGEFAYNKSYSNGYPMGAFKRLEDMDKAVVTTLYICFSIKPNTDSNFINQFFDAGLMVPELMKIAQEGGRAHGLLNIGLSDFFSLKLTLPPKPEQTAIAQVLQCADDELRLLTNKLTELQAQKKGLMQQLLMGKKRLIQI